MCTSNGGKWDIYVYYITTWSHVEFPGKLRGNWVKLDEEENLAATAVEIWNMITIHEYWCGCVRMLFRMCVGEGEGWRRDRGREKKKEKEKSDHKFTSCQQLSQSIGLLVACPQLFRKKTANQPTSLFTFPPQLYSLPFQRDSKDTALYESSISSAEL